MRSIQSTLFGLLIASTATYADTTLNLTQGVSPISHDVYDLHMTIFWICVVIGIGVFGAMFYAMIYHRKSKGVKPAEFHSHPGIEIAWTIIPFLILVLMAIPATRVLLRMNNVDPEELTIKITGYQWKWHYEYLEDNINFFSNLATPYDQIINKAPKTAGYLSEVDHPLVVPIHKKIRFLVTSNDVNHAWWVPDLAVKRDAIPGYINEAWTIIDKPGTYVGHCAELCGINHAFMPIVVMATTDEGYKNWVAQQKGQATAAGADVNKAWTMQELMANGEKVYSRICAACHQPGGVGMPPTFPALKGDKFTTGPIEKHVNIVMNGVTGTAMQAFKNQLGDVDIASVVTYERNAFGNNTNTMIQPIQVKALRDGKSFAEAIAIQPTGVAAAPAAAAPAPPAPALQAAPAQPAPAAVSAPAAQPAPAAPATTAPSTVIIHVYPSAKTGEAPTVKVQPAPAAPVQPAAAVPAQAAPAAISGVDELKQAIDRGEKVYQGTCIACHQAGGTGMPPTFPALKGSKVATGPVTIHIHTVMFGVPHTAMQAFKDQFNDQQLADVITYERNAWENNTGTLVRPQDIASARSAASAIAPAAATTPATTAPATSVPAATAPAAPTTGTSAAPTSGTTTTQPQQGQTN